MNLATRAAVKTYLSIASAGSDALIDALIPRASDYLQAWLGREFPTETFANKRLDGTGSRRQMLLSYPLLTLSRLNINQQDVSPSPDGVITGYLTDDKFIYLVGAVFPRGLQNIVASWESGYRDSETANVPTGNGPTLIPATGGAAAVDEGVAYTANGAALAVVGSSPLSGQYSFANGSYTFNTAQANVSVTMTYDFIPPSIVQACCELVGLKIKQRDNLGIRSKSLAGESITYEDRDLSPSTRGMLQPYRRWVPV